MEFNRRGCKNPWKNMIITVVVSSICVVALSYFVNGIYIKGIPRPDNISKIIVEDTNSMDGVKVYTDKEHIYLACKLRNNLNYELGTADESLSPTIAISYEQKDGSVVIVEANESTLWYEGKAHPLKSKGEFVELVEGF